jgi:uncharacterized protein YndB with AHSA1/START domain
MGNPQEKWAGVLELRRLIPGSKEKVFSAWTEPQQLLLWWEDLTRAEMDLRVGGEYRLGWKKPKSPQEEITSGEFEQVVAPDRLVYTWLTGKNPESLVTVDFVERLRGTEIFLVQERIPTKESLEAQRAGWNLALDCLENFLERGPRE